jgi:ATP-dependent exoDNAse (exonuclease V) beta subunit
MGSLAPGFDSPDTRSRREALDVRESFLVRAPAGSGKTELLIQRFLALLATVTAPESVLAITFTRKAAAEMQERILTTMQRARAGVPPESQHDRLSYDLALTALEQDRIKNWRLLEHPSRLRIQTIDSLCASIARQMPWLTRLGSPPSPTEDAGPLFIEAARRALAEIEHNESEGPALEALLMHLDNNVPRTVELIAGMLETRDQWLPLVASGPISRTDLERALCNTVHDGLSRAHSAIPAELWPELVELAAFAAANLETGSEFALWRGRDEPPGTHPDDRGLWVALAGLLMTHKGTLRQKVDRRHGFHPGCHEKARFTALLSTLGRDEQVREALVMVRALPPSGYTDGQWLVLKSLFRVLKLAVAHLKIIFREAGEADFCEIAEGARWALGHAEAPSDIALGLDARLQHLLVDEFQDTSVAQYDLLERIIAGWEPGDGRTLFLVGDPMQSIYRFRHAEVGLFLRASTTDIGPTRPRFLCLSANYRSVKPLVDWANGTFSAMFPAADDVASGAVRYGPAIPAYGKADEGAVTVHALRHGEDAEEAALVVRLIRREREFSPARSVAVLVRARSHLPQIVAALRRERIPFRAIDIDTLGDRTVVRDLLALTRAMLHPGDRPSWLAILRAPWCGLTLADLEALAGRERGAAIWDLLHRDLAGITPDGRRRAIRLRAVLENAFAERGRWPLRRWVEHTWTALGGPACLCSDDAAQDASDFLDLLERRSRAGEITDFDSLTREAGELHAKPDTSADASLQLLTIHKAKGLQFDTVIVPGLGRLPNRDKSKLLRFAEQPQPDGTVDRLVATIRETGVQSEPAYDYLQRLERQRDDHEAIRLLYVATSRARTRLHLIGQAVQYKNGEVYPKHGSFLEVLWPHLRPDERQQFVDCYGAAPNHTHAAASSPGVPLLRLPELWTPMPLPSAVTFRASRQVRVPEPTYEWVGDMLRHAGTVVHAALQRIAREGLEEFDAVRVRRERSLYRSALANLGVVPSEMDSAIGIVEEALVRTLSSPRGRWVLSAHQEDRCEYAVAGLLDGEIVHGTMDRTFLEDYGVRWIIDYKTSSHEGGSAEAFLNEQQRRYRPQLERYARLLASGGRPVRLGLYFPLLDGWREWEPGEE